MEKPSQSEKKNVHFGNEPSQKELPAKSLLKKAIEVVAGRPKADVHTGFNVFSILGLERREVRTHSAFIYELINPSGSHGNGNTFLKLFVRYVLGAGHDPCEGALQVAREDVFGEGRIDFTIQTPLHFYAVEMKIDAGDQPGQLKRYDNYCRSQAATDYTLYYLTLDGHKASDISADEHTDYTPVAFKETEANPLSIQRWLRECQKVVADTEVLSVILSQYQAVVEKITSEYERDMGMMDLIQNESAWKVVSELVSARNNIQVEMVSAFFDKIQQYLGNQGLTLFKQSDSASIENYCKTSRNTYPHLMYEIPSRFEKYQMYFMVELGPTLYCLAGVRNDRGENVMREQIEEKSIMAAYDSKYENVLKIKKYNSEKRTVSYWNHIKYNRNNIGFKDPDALFTTQKELIEESWAIGSNSFFKDKALAAICKEIFDCYKVLEAFLK